MRVAGSHTHFTMKSQHRSVGAAIPLRKEIEAGLLSVGEIGIKILSFLLFC